MTKKELIKELERFPDDMEIKYKDWDVGFYYGEKKETVEIDSVSEIDGIIVIE